MSLNEEDRIQTSPSHTHTAAHSWTEAYGSVCVSNTKKKKSSFTQRRGCLLATCVHCVPFLQATSLPAPHLTFPSFPWFLFNNSKDKSQPSPRCHLSLHPHPRFIKNRKCSANHFYERLSTSVHVGGSWRGSADKKMGAEVGGLVSGVPCLLPAPIQCGLCPCSPWRMR